MCLILQSTGTLVLGLFCIVWLRFLFSGILSCHLLILCWRNTWPLTFTEWRYHMLLMYNYVLLKMGTRYSKHVEESNNIWRINNIQCITLVVLYGQFMMHGQRNIKLLLCPFIVRVNTAFRTRYIQLPSTLLRFIM